MALPTPRGGGRRGGRGQGRGGHSNIPAGSTPIFHSEMDVSFRGGASNRVNHGGSGFGSRGGFVQRSVTREQQNQSQGQAQGIQAHHSGRNRNAIALPPSTSSTRIVITKEMEDEILALNNKYLRSQDSEFRCIIEKASQAAIYCYKLGEDEGWADAKAAGCLMLYERNASPPLGFIILNRFAFGNWVHWFTPNQVEIQVQGKYLLFKSGPEIFCLWFYQDNDPEKFGEIMKRLGCEVAEDEHPSQTGHPSESYSKGAGR